MLPVLYKQILAVISLAASAGSIICPPYGSGGFGGIFAGYNVPSMYDAYRCPPDTVFYYYTCCDSLFGECCLHLETWFIIIIVVAIILILMICIGCLAACIYGFRRTSDET
ncbi:unnamed protein product [Enterobius vermicularis]|uniref:CX domain-containing protein n=1 Tax=Enterobius vermicularis TaxID=51028 RepID=A0A0N4VEB8_ENTVE|nr:unnamed protein product [Enterobius vermicularis]